MPVKSRLPVALALALVVALLTATGSLLGSSWQSIGKTSPSASSADDVGENAVVSQPLLVVAVVLVLALVAPAIASTSDAGAGDPRRARAPPSR